MIGSKTVSDRLNLLDSCSKIIFNSEWSKKQFLKDLKNFYHKSKKLEVIHQSTNKTKVDLNKKEKLITFVGKLNTSKGYDIYKDAIIRILNEFNNWKGYSIGDEDRKRPIINHKNHKELGFLKHKKVLQFLKDKGADVLGIDASLGNKQVGTDLNEEQLLELISSHSGEVTLLLSPMGGQGFLIGRGNLQLSPNVLKGININDILNWGDDYQLIFTANKKFRNTMKKHKLGYEKIGVLLNSKK